ncbi:unnamed protein product [Acanthoscelides obtectus]|uniref:Uncharacterized protein n=1 Tax=Acanthoscelides obtectus TaxID=200917 RepID=A0A9P0L5H3_ACAOB|nr:unnamed protein product [Acanthoscelides obtectus]CAK1676639.1 hypothetical protein AOBTE_LOCUS30875 [Acanthoscelides obtectus]
MLCSPSRIRVC